MFQEGAKGKFLEPSYNILWTNTTELKKVEKLNIETTLSNILHLAVLFTKQFVLLSLEKV